MKKILIALAVFALFGSAQASTITVTTEKPLVIRLSHVVKDVTPKALASIEFKRIMEEKFPGRVIVEVSHDNKLFKDREESEALELGVVDVIVPTTGKVASLYKIPEFELFDLPFLFNTHADIAKFTNSTSGQKLIDRINSKSKTAYAVTYWANDFQNFFGSKPIKKPDDLKGLTAVVTSGGTKSIFLNALGVKETLVLPFASVAKTLKKDGEYKADISSNTNSNFYSSKIYESSKYLTLSNHDVSLYVFLTNKRWLNSLPDDIKTGFLAAAKESGIYHFDAAQKAGSKDLEQAKKEGVNIYTLSADEKNQFKKKAISSHENYLKNINKEFLNEVYQIVR